MKRHSFIQGSAEWHAHRATARNASEAPAVLGCSPYMTRQQLLHAMHTGLRPEVSADLQRRFDDGHAIEAAQREVAAAMIGEPLYPVVGCEVVEGIELSASFDGLTMAEDVAYECKTLNADLRACMPNPGTDDNDGRDLPKMYRAQMEQQLAVSGAERVLFVAATKDGSDVRRCWYYPDPALRAEILVGWRQFDADLAAYVPPVAEAPKPVGQAPETLPALRIEITGAVTASNLAEFKETALGAIRSVNRELTTDAHFADAEQAVKWCGEVETRIKAAKEHALSQTATIEALFRALDDVSAEARRVRLDLEKLVTRRKEEIKGEMVAAAKRAYEAHEAAVRQETGAWVVFPSPDFAAAIKGKRSVDAMRDALDTTLANGKIKVDEAGRKIRAALAALDEESKGFEHLFRDRLSFIAFGPDEVRALARARITEHRAAEERRAAELAERERARIRAEEAARVEREAQERAAAERRQREEQEALERRQREETAARAELQRQEQAALETEQRRQEAAAKPLAAIATPSPAAGPAVIPMPTRAPAAPAGPPTLKLGEINARLSPIQITAEGLVMLGFPVVATSGAAKLWHEHQFHAICEALIAHIAAARDAKRQAA